MYLGVDIGSSSSKAVILDGKGQVVGQAVINIGTGSRGPQKVIEEALTQAGIARADIKKTVVTGYGRMTFEGADKLITEISCHAKGVSAVLRKLAPLSISVGRMQKSSLSMKTEMSKISL